MEAILRAADSAVCQSTVVVDEAYQPFAQQSWMPRGGLRQPAGDAHRVQAAAGIRTGYVAGAPEWLAQLDKVRPPYNVNCDRAAALFALEHVAVLDEQAARLRAERANTWRRCRRCPVTVFPSAANFLLLRVARWRTDLRPSAGAQGADQERG